MQLGQKGLLIDTQGNWGNILTGDEAAAGRYIEAKLSPFALEVAFDDDITEMKPTYDATAEEPVCLPVRFPLLLAQGAEGIAVGLSSKIYPHNPKELLEASIAYLENKSFELYPDFPTGGLLDVDRYNDGRRGGQLKSRARIERIGERQLSITSLPYGKTTSTLIDSILRANDKGQIKVKHIDDMTAQEADIRIQLPQGVSTDKTIDGLYAFTDCEVPLSPNACVIRDGKPCFLGISDLLKYSADRTVSLLKEELEHRREGGKPSSAPLFWQPYAGAHFRRDASHRAHGAAQALAHPQYEEWLALRSRRKHNPRTKYGTYRATCEYPPRPARESHLTKRHHREYHFHPRHLSLPRSLRGLSSSFPHEANYPTKIRLVSPDPKSFFQIVPRLLFLLLSSFYVILYPLQNYCFLAISRNSAAITNCTL